MEIKGTLPEYDLPDSAIALYPSVPRDSCRLLLVELESLKISDMIFRDIYGLLNKGDVVAVNSSRVIKARLHGHKKTGGKIEFLLVEKMSQGRWYALGKPFSGLKEGMELEIQSPSGILCRVLIEKKLTDGNLIISAPENIEEFGSIPLPPYIASKREPVTADYADYQTVFSREPGSVASPTASLHFTEELVEKLEEKGVGFAHITLHVGPGTFRADYRKPAGEMFFISGKEAETINRAERVIVCGTTAMRAVETACSGGIVREISGKTELFIRPGYNFQIPDMFLTNFHLPGTPLIQMVAAYIQDRTGGDGVKYLRDIYSRALELGYRFLSYGDAMLLV